MTQENGRIDIVAESHGDEAGLAEIRHRVEGAKPGTTVLLELPTLLNGPISAYYNGDINKSGLKRIMEGYAFVDFVDHADQITNLIVDLKERGVPVVAYDARETHEASVKNQSTFEHYAERKNAQMEVEIKAFNKSLDAAKAKNMPAEDIASMISEFDSRQKIVQLSIDRIKEFQDKPLVHMSEEVIHRLQAAGTTNMDLLGAAVIDRFTGPQGNSIVQVGDVHVNGRIYNWQQDYMMAESNGILHEGLKELGYQPHITYARPSARDFVVKKEDLAKSPAVVGVVFDEFVTHDPDTGARISYKSAEEVAAAVYKADPDHKHEFAKSLDNGGQISSETGNTAPTADHSQFAGMLKDFDRQIAALPCRHEDACTPPAPLVTGGEQKAPASIVH